MTNYICMSVPFDAKKYFVSHSSVSFKNFSFATLVCTHIEMYASILFINQALNILLHLLPLIITQYYFCRETLLKILSSHNIIQIDIYTYIHILNRVIVNINHTTVTTCIDKNLINFNLFLPLLSLSLSLLVSLVLFHPLV